MTNQEIIDAIEAEIAKTFAETGKLKLGTIRSLKEVFNHWPTSTVFASPKNSSRKESR